MNVSTKAVIVALSLVSLFLTGCGSDSLQDINPKETRIWATYSVDAGEEVRLCYMPELVKKMFIGNKEVEPTEKYTFPNAGEYTVSYCLNEEGETYFLFNRCTALTSVTLPSAITEIGREAFCGCTALKSVAIGKRVITIDDGAFDECTSLTSIDIPKSVTTIGEKSFRKCSALDSIVIPAFVTTIGNFAFQDCASLRAITSKATTAPSFGGDYVFYGVKSKGTLTVPTRAKGYDAWMDTSRELSLGVDSNIRLSWGLYDWDLEYSDEL